jgi:hypothetical protein
LFLEVIVQREAHIVFKTSAFDPGSFGLDRHARLELVEQARRASGLFRHRPIEKRLLSNRLRCFSRPGSGNRFRGRRR